MNQASAQEWMTRMRSAVMNAITEDDMREIVQNLVKAAKRGERQSVQLLQGWIGSLQPVEPKQPPVQLHVHARARRANKTPKKVPLLPKAIRN